VNAVLKIEVISDVACPWCAVGVHALGKALQTLAAEGIACELSFQPFELNPDMPPEGQPLGPYLAEKYGIDEAQIRRNQALLRERGAAVGFAFGERGHVWNTFDAHRLLHWAGAEGPAGAQHALALSLLQSYHGEGRNPSDPAVLLDATARAALDVERARAVLGSDEFASDVRAEQVAWMEAGIDSVPSVVVDRRHLIQGAQEPEVFARELRRLAAAAPAG
jgi:predicted DsbA family dithiol-disulfide isomerase